MHPNFDKLDAGLYIKIGPRLCDDEASWVRRENSKVTGLGLHSAWLMVAHRSIQLTMQDGRLLILPSQAKAAYTL